MSSSLRRGCYAPRLAERERRGIRRLGADLRERVEAVGGDAVEQGAQVLDAALEAHAGAGCHELVLEREQARRRDLRVVDEHDRARARLVAHRRAGRRCARSRSRSRTAGTSWPRNRPIMPS